MRLKSILMDFKNASPERNRNAAFFYHEVNKPNDKYNCTHISNAVYNHHDIVGIENVQI